MPYLHIFLILAGCMLLATMGGYLVGCIDAARTRRRVWTALHRLHRATEALRLAVAHNRPAHRS